MSDAPKIEAQVMLTSQQLQITLTAAEWCALAGWMASLHGYDSMKPIADKLFRQLNGLFVDT